MLLSDNFVARKLISLLVVVGNAIWVLPGNERIVVTSILVVQEVAQI
jgi:hypothetical protein